MIAIRKRPSMLGDMQSEELEVQQLTTRPVQSSTSELLVPVEEKRRTMVALGPSSARR